MIRTLRSAYVAAVTLALAGLVTISTAASVGAAATEQERSVWDGVYSEAQSKRGEKVYGDSCANCHGADLAGGQVVPPLSGDDFLMKWNGSMVGDLFELVRTTMPQDAPESLMPAQYADVLAFVFSKNKMPSGTSELAGNFDALKTIRIEPPKKHF